MRFRNPFTIRARQRKAGAMKHKTSPRGGARQAARREIEHEVAGLTFTCIGCDAVEEACLPHRTARVVYRANVCDECQRRLGVGRPLVSPATQVLELLDDSG
jgi:hypothetical protein